MLRAKKSLLVGLVLGTAAVLPGLVPSAAYAATDLDVVAPQRANALRACNAKASPFALYAWGDWQLYVYRVCMYDRGQKE